MSAEEGTRPDDLRLAWEKVVSGLEPQHRAWLRASRPLTMAEDNAIIAVPNDFTRSQLEGRLRAELEQRLSEALSMELRISAIVSDDITEAADAVEASPAGEVDDIDSTLAGDKEEGHRAHAADEGTDAQVLPLRSESAAPPPSPEPAPSDSSHLNNRYTFSSFVIGGSNRFPHAAAIAAAESPGKAYNPLLIYGESGLGKTHLLHAIGHYVRSLYAGARVKYVSSEEFTNQFINAIRGNRVERFQRIYRSVDVLLIDDIQFLEGKETTQEEFFHTFNTLHTANKQIVLTCDRAPKRLEALEGRLRSRFEWGLITDVTAPDLETRIAILRKKAASDRLTVPPEVLEFIASRVKTNIRELEGALIRVTAFAALNQQEVDTTLAEVVLRDLIPVGAEPEITADAIIKHTAAYFELSVEELTGRGRNRHLVTARQIAMYLCRELTDLSLPDIGRQFDRDHTTVMYADRKINELLAEKRAIYTQVADLTSKIKVDSV